MKNLAILVLLALTVFTACKNEAPTPSEPEESEEVVEETTEEPSEETPAEPEEEPEEEEEEEIVKTYSGNYFTVAYPAVFSIDSEDTDYASFASPDGTVHFSIYSPLWANWTDTVELIMPDPLTETEVSRKVENNIVAQSELGANVDQEVTWITVTANDGSYTRSIVDSVLTGHDGSQTQKVFSYQYQNQNAYNNHIDRYLKFKNSLTQSAD